MAIQPVGALGRFILYGIEERLIIGDPGNAGDAFDLLGEVFASAKALHMQAVLAESFSVGRVRQPMIIIADLEGAQPKERMALGKLVRVEEKLFGGALFISPAIMVGILLAFDGFGEVQIAAQSVRHG